MSDKNVYAMALTFYQMKIVQALVQLRPVAPLPVDFKPKISFDLRFKFLHVRSSFAVKYVYPLLVHPYDGIAMLKSSQFSL